MGIPVGGWGQKKSPFWGGDRDGNENFSLKWGEKGIIPPPPSHPTPLPSLL